MIVKTGPTYTLGVEVMVKAAALFRVSGWDIICRGSTRERPIVQVRWAIVWTLRQLTDSKGRKKFSSWDLGRLLGYSDHTTIGYGARQAGILRGKDEAFRAKTDALLAHVRETWGAEV